MKLNRSILILVGIMALFVGLWSFIVKPKTFNYNNYFFYEFNDELWCLKKSFFSYYIGKVDGLVYSQYQNGIPKFNIQFRSGIASGNAIYFHKNGKVKLKGNYLSGQKIGKWVKFNFKGKPLFEFHHLNKKQLAKTITHVDYSQCDFKEICNRDTLSVEDIFYELLEYSLDTNQVHRHNYRFHKEYDSYHTSYNKSFLEQGSVFEPTNINWVKSFYKYNYDKEDGRLLSKGLYRSVWGEGLFKSSLFKYSNDPLLLRYSKRSIEIQGLISSKKKAVHPLDYHSLSTNLVNNHHFIDVPISMPVVSSSICSYNHHFTNFIDNDYEQKWLSSNRDKFENLSQLLIQIDKKYSPHLNKIDESIFVKPETADPNKKLLLFNDIWLSDCVEFSNADPNLRGDFMALVDMYLGEKNTFRYGSGEAFEKKIWVRDSTWSFYNGQATTFYNNGESFTNDSLNVVEYVLGAVKQGVIELDKSLVTKSPRDIGLPNWHLKQRVGDPTYRDPHTFESDYRGSANRLLNYLFKVSFNNFEPTAYDLNFEDGTVHYTYQSKSTLKEYGLYDGISPAELKKHTYNKEGKIGASSKNILFTNINGNLSKVYIDTNFYDHNLKLENKAVKKAFPNKGFSGRGIYVDYHDKQGTKMKSSVVEFRTLDKKQKEVRLRRIRQYDYRGNIYGEQFLLNGRPFGNWFGYSFGLGSKYTPLKYETKHKDNFSKETKYYYPSGQLFAKTRSITVNNPYRIQTHIVYYKNGKVAADYNHKKETTDRLVNRGYHEKPTKVFRKDGSLIYKGIFSKYLSRPSENSTLYTYSREGKELKQVNINKSNFYRDSLKIVLVLPKGNISEYLKANKNREDVWVNGEFMGSGIFKEGRIWDGYLFDSISVDFNPTLGFNRVKKEYKSGRLSRREFQVFDQDSNLLEHQVQIKKEAGVDAIKTFRTAEFKKYLESDINREFVYQYNSQADERGALRVADFEPHEMKYYDGDSLYLSIDFRENKIFYNSSPINNIEMPLRSHIDESYISKKSDIHIPYYTRLNPSSLTSFGSESYFISHQDFKLNYYGPGMFFVDLRIGIGGKADSLELTLDDKVKTIVINSIVNKFNSRNLYYKIWGKDLKNHTRKSWKKSPIKVLYSSLTTRDYSIRDAVSFKYRLWFQVPEGEHTLKLKLKGESPPGMLLKFHPDTYLPSGLNLPTEEIYIDFDEAK